MKRSSGGGGCGGVESWMQTCHTVVDNHSPWAHVYSCMFLHAVHILQVLWYDAVIARMGLAAGVDLGTSDGHAPTLVLLMWLLVPVLSEDASRC